MAFETISDKLRDVPTDQIIAIACQIISVFAAILYYHVMHIKVCSVQLRHAFPAILGVIFAIVLYGMQALHLLVLCIISYSIMTFVSTPYRGWLAFAVAVSQVLSVHLYYYLQHYMEGRLDVSGSLMVMAMKASCTAFSLDDGGKAESVLTRRQQRNKLMKQMNFFEYFCFCFCFLGLLFGPFYHYKDYQSFVQGEQYRTKWPLMKALTFLCVSFLCLFFHYLLSQRFSALYNNEETVMNSGFIVRHGILWFTMFTARLKYYFGWISSEAICYLCGLGYDPNITGEDEWGASIPTVKIRGIEFATSLKMFADSWNIFTAHWLQFCVYERVKSYKVLCVFILSATWHGFYPGYFMMFAPLGFAIVLGRKLRRSLRPKFQSTYAGQTVYDVITWIATITLIAFNSCAFELKEWHSIYKLQRSFYFWPHILVILGVLLVPSNHSTSSKADDSNLSLSADQSINTQAPLAKNHSNGHRVQG